MANELLTRDDIIRGKQNFDAQNQYMTGAAEEQVTLPDGKKIKTRAGLEKEIKDKFPDSKAGMRDVGEQQGNVMEVGAFGLGARAPNVTGSGESLISDIRHTGFVTLGGSFADSPLTSVPEQSVMMSIKRDYNAGASINHLLFSDNRLFFRSFRESDASAAPWSELYSNSSAGIYVTTTATSANTVVTPNGELQRSTSSKIFKHDIADIDISNYREALKAVRPVSYRSTEATSDRTDWSWYSFIAEELAAIDPRLVQMDNVEFFEDTKEDGTTFINSRELPEGEYAANGINTNGIVALMVHINQQMLADIEKLEDEKTQLKRRTTNLEKRMDAFDGSTPAE